MKLSLTAAIIASFALVVCQAEVQGEDQTDNPYPPNPIVQRMLMNEGFESKEQDREITKFQNSDRPLVQIVETIVNKIKEIGERISSTLEPIKDLLNRNGFTNLSNAMENFIQAINYLTNGVEASRSTILPYQMIPQQWIS